MVIFFDKFFKGMWLNGIFMLYFYEFYDIFTSFYDLNAYTSVCMCICTHRKFLILKNKTKTYKYQYSFKYEINVCCD